MNVTEKLQIRPGQSVAVIDPPAGFALDHRVEASLASSADAVVGFAVCAADLDRLTAVITAAREDRLAWIAYPKAGQLGTDLNRDRLAGLMEKRGLRPVRQVAIDTTWSALRFRPVRP